MSVKFLLIDILKELSEEQFKTFKWRLENGADGRKISHCHLELADRKNTIDLMMSHVGSAHVLEAARKILDAIPRKDLADKLMRTGPAQQAQQRQQEPLKEPPEKEGIMERPLRPMALASEMKGAVVREILTTSLQRLRPDQFEKFKAVLCETSLKELVAGGDSSLDQPNQFQRGASLESLVEDLVGKFGRTYALKAAATVMEKIGQRELAKALLGEMQALQVTSHGLRRKPKEIPKDEDSYCRLL